MTLFVIVLGGLVALVAVLCAMDAAWQHTNRSALAMILGDELPTTENIERSLTADLLSGAISAEQYRAAAGALAAGEPQPAALQRLVS